MASAASAAIVLTGHRMPASLRPLYNVMSITTSRFPGLVASYWHCHLERSCSWPVFSSLPLSRKALWSHSCWTNDGLRIQSGRNFCNSRLGGARSASSSSVTLAAGAVESAATTSLGQTSDVIEKPSWRASIDFKWIRENKDAIAANIINRNSSGDVEAVVQLYEQSVQLSMVVDKLRAERNSVANAMKGKMEKSKREELISQGKLLKDQLANLEQELDLLSDKLQVEGQKIPNMTHPSVPLGSEEFATVRKLVGSQREFAFPVKDHVELGLALDLFEFEAAAEVSGAKFYYLKNEAVLLEMALINWTLAQLRKKGFVLLSTPDLVRASVVEKCGFQPRGKSTQVYSIEGTDLCLAGTSEILLGGLYMDSMIPEASLPLRLVAFSHCFRTEAGAAGASSRA